MTLTLLVAFGIVAFWVVILLARSLRGRPMTQAAARRAIFAASGFSGALIGGAFPIGWAMTTNMDAFLGRGITSFTFAGHLPPGVDEDDLLVFLVIGLAILLIQAVAEVWRACR